MIQYYSQFTFTALPVIIMHFIFAWRLIFNL